MMEAFSWRPKGSLLALKNSTMTAPMMKLLAVLLRVNSAVAPAMAVPEVRSCLSMCTTPPELSTLLPAKSSSAATKLKLNFAALEGGSMSRLGVMAGTISWALALALSHLLLSGTTRTEAMDFLEIRKSCKVSKLVPSATVLSPLG